MRSANVPEIPGFEIVNTLGGARASVFRARNTSTGDDVVIKVLDRTKEPVLPKRFDRERKTLLRLAATNVGYVPLLTNGVSSTGHDYIVSPYYELGSMQDQVGQGPMPWRLAAELMAKVASIVGCAHAEGVVLGDVRPSNIMLQAVGQPVMAAFGMATRRFDDGTPVFTAPEKEDPKFRLTPPADVYSLSLVFGALLAGRAKERSESNEDYLAELRAVAPERFIEVIEHGLSSSPTNRHRDAQTMERAISAAISSDPESTLQASVDLHARDPLDLDEIFAEAEEPKPSEPPSTVGLPPGLEDIIFLQEDVYAVDAGDGADLSLPAGLEDLVIISPNTHRSQPPSQGAANAEPRIDDLFDADDPTLVPFDIEAEAADQDRHTDQESTSSDNGPDADDDVDEKVETKPSSIATLIRADDQTPGELTAPEDQTTAPNLDELQDQTTAFNLDELVVEDDHDDEPEEDSRDATTIFDLDELEATRAAYIEKQVADETPPSLPAPDLEPVHASAGVAFSGDLTEVFGSQATQGEELDELAVPTAAMSAGPALSPFSDPLAEEIPFTGVGRVRAGAEPQSWLARTQVATEVFWFRTRRSLASSAAVLGVIAIAAMAVFVVAREIQSSETEAEGSPFTPTTATSPVSFAAPSGPARPVATFPTDLPKTTTTKAAPRRTSATTAQVASPTTAAVASTARSSTVKTTDVLPTTPSSTVELTTVRPPSTVATTRRTTTTDDVTTTRRPTTTRRVTTTRRTTTTRRPTTSRPTTSLPTSLTLPTTASTTATTAVSTSTTGSEVTPPTVQNPATIPAKPKVVSIETVGVASRSATVSYTSDQCVATQFTLSGSDGSVQTGSSPGFNPRAHCALGWQLDFTGRNGLEPETDYTLAVTIKARGSELTTSSQVSFTTLDT